MDFQLSNSQRALIEGAQKAYEKVLLPLTHDDSINGLHKLRRAMGAQGLLGLTKPTELGGVGLSLLDALLVIQTLTACSTSVGSFAHTSSTGVGGSILKHGTKAQKEFYIPRLCSGEIGMSIGITEPEAGSAATNMRTRAAIEGDTIVINGSKQFVSYIDRNEHTLLYCRFGQSGTAADIGAVIVPHDAPGFSHSSGTSTMGEERLFELYFDDCRIPAENLLLSENAFGKLISDYNVERLGSISRMLGMAEAAYEHALGYTQERNQFNRKISEFQGVQWMLADMRIKLDAAKLLTYRAAATAGVDRLPDALETSIAKVFVAEAAKEICDKAIQIHGANGYTTEYPLAHLYAEARAGSIYGGTVQIHRNMVAGRILGVRNSQWKNG